MKLKVLLFLSLSFSISISNYISAQESAEDKIGNWLMYFGTTKMSEKFSIHTEAQFRYFETTGSIDQLLLRTGLNYHFKNYKDQKSSLTLGYGQIYSYPYEKSKKTSYSNEYRIWQQLITNSVMGPINLNHRYRLEQRWVDKADITKYYNRARYRLMLTLPLFRCSDKKADYAHQILPGTTYLGIYDEMFINLEGKNNLAQNRLYFAIGHKLNSNLNFQVGYLNQILGNTAYHRLQFGLFINLDFSKLEDQ